MTEPAPLTPRRGRYDFLAAVLASGVSLLALCVSAYSTYWQRQQTRAMVWPRLEWSYSNIPDFKIVVHNVGVGPAELRAVSVTLDGKPVKTWGQATRPLAADEKGNVDFGTVTSFLQGRVLGAGAEIIAFEIKDPVASERVFRGEDRLGVHLCYCSVLQECWRLGRSAAGEKATEPVASCEGEPNGFEQ